MAAPSKAWVAIADSQVDADSPVDTTLITGLRDDVEHLREVAYDPAIHTAAKAHTHNGTDSAPVLAAQMLCLDTEYTHTTSSWLTVDTIRLYMPAGISALKYSVRIKAAGGVTTEARLEHATAGAGSAMSTMSTSYVWVDEGSLNVAGLAGWHTFNVQLHWSAGASGTAYMNKIMVRFA